MHINKLFKVSTLTLGLLCCHCRSSTNTHKRFDAEGDRNLDADLIHDSDDTQPFPDADQETDSEETEILGLLREIEGMTVSEFHTEDSRYRYFELAYEQPVDHNNPESTTFIQYMSLLHISTEAPFVLATTGYGNYYWDYQTELTRLFAANQLVYEHRYYADSTPFPTDWSYLTIEQSATDSHRIVNALKPIYSGPWLATGASKGGMTSIYHYRFYPDDVDGVVAYVAPISFGAPDARYISFLDNVGQASCRTALRQTQLEALTRRTAMLDRLRVLENDYSFDLIGGIEHALEFVVTDLPFTFWQYIGESECENIPSSTANDDAIFSFVDMAVGFSSASNRILERYIPYHYQAWTELGYPDVALAHLTGLLLTDAPTLEEGILPEGVTAAYDPTVMQDIAEWVSTAGERIMFIYGEYDPWTAGSFELGDALDSYSFTVTSGTHSANIQRLRQTDRDLALDILERWLSVSPKRSALSQYEPPPENPRWQGFQNR